MTHLVEHFRNGRISIADFEALQDWLNADPEVPPGHWYLRFRTFTLAGEGDVPKLFARINRFSRFASAAPFHPQQCDMP